MLRLHALRTPLIGPIDLEIETGRCVALSGASGAGKTLLLRAIVDLDPNEGNVFLDGESRAAMSACQWRRRVALVPAESGWWSDRVGDHFPPGQPDRELTEALGLSRDVGEWSVSRLSTGERHRLAIARAVCRQPQILLLDEPTASLDTVSTGKVEALIERLLARNLSVLLVTHDPGQPDRLDARQLIIEAGRLRGYGNAP